MLILLSTALVYTNFDKPVSIISNPRPATPQDVSFDEDKKVDSITEKVTEMIQQLDKPMLLSYLQKITSFGPHPTARRALGKIFDLPIEKLREYLINELESMGLDVRTQYWEQKPTLRNLLKPIYYPGWLVGENIEATLHGTDQSSNEIYIITAHYDSWPGSPGANDDGSGVATILSMAKIMSGYSFNHSVCFLLVDGEEQGLYGSYAYSEECCRENKNIVATINIEDFGFAETEEGCRKIHSIENEESCWITKTISDNCQKYCDCIHLEVVPQRKTDGYCADYMNFWEFGYDSVCIWEYEWDHYCHTQGDALETINFPYLTRGARILLATFAEWAWGI